jgi:beta-glucanase (GH16 family)
MNRLALLLTAAIFPLIYSCSNAPAEKWELVWSDEFDYAGLPDETKWSYDTAGNAWAWGNNELQYYTALRPENAWVENGALQITALLEEMEGRKYTSARLISKDKGDWLYGRFEIRAKLPTGVGIWPAIWMLPTDWEYGGWPDSGEIDIMENVGYDPDTIVASAHTKSYNHGIGTHKNAKIYVPSSHTGFHVYTLEWEANEYRVFVDNQHFFTFKNEGTGFAEWPFDKRFHLLLNVAVGGNWGGRRGIDDSIFPQTMQIDYVRVYRKNE